MKRIRKTLLSLTVIGSLAAMLILGVSKIRSRMRSPSTLVEPHSIIELTPEEKKEA